MRVYNSVNYERIKIKKREVYINMPNLTTIKCPKCGESFEPSEAFKHQLEVEILAGERAKHKEDIAKVREEAEKLGEAKIKSEYEDLIKQLRKDSSEEKERNIKLLKQLEDLTEELRQLRRKDEERELEMKKKIAAEEEGIREDARKKIIEENELKDREKDKKLTDALKQIEELKNKIQQGSQQAQGESMELELEEILRKEFPADSIEEVKKGQRGADVLQRVIDKNGKDCGTILWESKNAKWSGQWVSKLKEDQRQAKAHLAVLVVTDPPEGLKTFIYENGIWIVVRKMAVSLALALRFDLVSVNYEKLVSVGKNEKMDMLYQYITSMEFKHRIEAIVESFGGLQEDMEKEKRWFQAKWARQEKQIRSVMDHTQGMYGDLQGVIGKSLPDIKNLELESGETESGVTLKL